jgi:hypothetical protein
MKLATLAVLVLALGAVDEKTASSGLREALRVGAQRAVALTSKPDGFFRNPQIRIPLPGQLESAAGLLRAMGMGAQVDELELSMNRAAERASKEALPVFTGAIKKMTIQDARGILGGDDTAATAYLRRTTGDDLRARFRPIVDTAMSQVGTVKTYDRFVGSVASVPFAGKPNLDLRAYVTEKALDGLFFMVGQEEKKIRTDPAARATVLLKSVFR